MDSSLSKPSFAAWTVWLIASLFYAFQYVLRVMPSIMLEDIMQQFNINAAAFGQFSGVYYIGYSLMHLPLGILLDRVGPRKVVTGCLLLTTLGLLPLIYTHSWSFPLLGRILVGMGSSAAILGVFKIIRMTFTEKRFSRMLSLSVMIGLLGAIYGGGPVSYMRETLGYSYVIQIFAAIGLLLALVTYWIVPDIQESQKNSVWMDLKEVLTSKRVILSCLFAGFMIGPLEGFADVWSNAYLKEVYGFEKALAASLPSMIFIGMCFGAPLLSLIAERTHNYLATIAGAGLIMAALFFVFLNWQLAPLSLSLSFILIGIGSAYQILAIYKASTYVSLQVAGLTTAIANMIIMVFGYGFHTVMGNIVNALGGPNSPGALKAGIFIIPITLLLGTLGFSWLLFQERKEVKAPILN